MISYSSVEDVISDLIVQATGLGEDQVRNAYQNASLRPAQDRETVVSFNLINQTQIGMDALIYENDSGSDLNETVEGDRNVTASIKTFTPSAQDVIERIAMYVYSSAATSFLSSNDIGFIRRGSIVNLTAIQNGEYEQRRQIDLEFHVSMGNTTTVNAIESAEIGYSVSGSQTITGTVEVK